MGEEVIQGEPWSGLGWSDMPLAEVSGSDWGYIILIAAFFLGFLYFSVKGAYYE